MNAIILAAGSSSRFCPLSYEIPKALLEVKGEILIERQIRQLLEAGISDIIVVVGYMADKFMYLRNKFGIRIVLNEDYNRFNNTSSVIRVIDELDDTYLCSSDNYFSSNLFLMHSLDSYYSALYAEGKTSEYCLTVDKDDNIINVRVGGTDSWYMIGYAFFNKVFSGKFRETMKAEYLNSETHQSYWEDVYIRHIKELPPLKIHRYGPNEIDEFDTLDELRIFDKSYISDTRSTVLKRLCIDNHWKESDLYGFQKTSKDKTFKFYAGNDLYLYDYLKQTLKKV